MRSAIDWFITRKMWMGSLVVILVFVFYFPITEQHTQSFKFVDEDEYIVVASLMNKGKKLYTDISTNHQPVTYIASQVIQKTAKVEPPNVFMLIKRHREAVFFWSVCWSLLLFFRFGWKVIPGVFVFEAIKYFVLGNEFVAESLVSYPMIYLGVSTYELLRYKDHLFFGLTSVLSVLFLLPLAIPVLVATLLRFVKTGKKMIKGFVLGGLLALLIVFAHISPVDYFRETIVNNYLYALPAVSEIQNSGDLIKVILFMPRSLFNGTNLLSWWARFFSISIITFFLISFFKGKRTHKVLSAGLMIMLITLNLRVLEVGTYFYAGFHLLPWLAVASVMAYAFLYDFLVKIPAKFRWFYVIILGLLSGILLMNRNSPILARRDTATEHYVQFAPVATASQIINLFKSEKDTLIVLPNETLINWITNLNTADRQVTYYDWQYQVPENRLGFEAMISGNLPDFIVFNDDRSGYSDAVVKIVKEKFLLLYAYSQNTGGFVETYVRKDKLEVVDKEAWVSYLELPITQSQEAISWYDENVKNN